MLDLDQALLAPEPTAITGQRPVGTDYTVAGHDQGQLICAICPGNGAGGAGPAECGGQLAVTAGLARRDLAQRPAKNAASSPAT